MTSKTTTPRPATTEAAMISREDLGIILTAVALAPDHMRKDSERIITDAIRRIDTAATEAAMIDPVRVAQTEARIRADEEAGTIAVMEPYDAVMTQIDYLAAVAEYAARGEDEELQQGLDGLRLLVERLASSLAAAAPPSGQVCVDREHVSAMRNELIRVDAQGGDLRVPVRQCVTWLLDVLSADADDGTEEE